MCPCKGAGFRFNALGDETGMLETCERNAAKDGGAICARDARSRTAGYVCAWEEDGLLRREVAESLVSDEEREWS